MRLLPLTLSSVKSLELSRAAGKVPVSILYCRSSLCSSTIACCAICIVLAVIHACFIEVSIVLGLIAWCDHPSGRMV